MKAKLFNALLFSLQKKVNCEQALPVINFNKRITGKEQTGGHLGELGVFKLWSLMKPTLEYSLNCPRKPPSQCCCPVGRWGGEEERRLLEDGQQGSRKTAALEAQSRYLRSAGARESLSGLWVYRGY